MLGLISLKFWYEVDRSFVLVLCKMSVNTVVTCINQPALEPFVARGITGVEGFVPILVPSQKVCILLETVWKIIQ